MLGVPLITKEKVVGVLEVINKRNNNFTETDEDLLLVLGAQAAAIENARLFQQSDLIAEFVHELRTPLASIGTTTYLLLRPEMSQEQREQMIHNIYSETLRLNTLASSFLDLARLESGRVQFHLTKFDLPPLLEECHQIMQSKADEDAIAINIETPADSPQVEADRDKLKQVVLNLLSNAIKYNCPNSSVTLTASMGERDWMLSVRDTGMGIPKSPCRISSRNSSRCALPRAQSLAPVWAFRFASRLSPCMEALSRLNQNSGKGRPSSSTCRRAPKPTGMQSPASRIFIPTRPSTSLVFWHLHKPPTPSSADDASQ
jgi:hypothetical protein